MTSPYTNLTSEEINAHLNMSDAVGYDGIYPSGESHFFDMSQSVTENPSPSVQSDTSIFNFDNLGSSFSNATESYVIDDFTVFNVYRHNNFLHTVNTSSLLRSATENFNIYSTSFRLWDISND